MPAENRLPALRCSSASSGEYPPEYPPGNDGFISHNFWFIIFILQFVIWCCTITVVHSAPRITKLPGRDSSVCTVTDYGLDDQEIADLFEAGTRDLISPQRPEHILAPPSLPSNLVPGLKRSGREVDRTPPSSAEVKNGRVIAPLPHKLWRNN
jgi:hypothetical protein